MAQPSVNEINATCVLLSSPNSQLILGDLAVQGKLLPNTLNMTGRNIDGERSTDFSSIQLDSFIYTGRGIVCLSKPTGNDITPNLLIYAGDNAGANNGQFVINSPMNVNTLTAPDPITQTIITKDLSVAGICQVLDVFRIDPETIQVPQNTTNALLKNKIIFSYLYNPAIPNQIQFTSSLFKYGMVFLKEVDGFKDLTAATLTLTNLDQPEPLLTITGIPNQAGICSAMLFVI